MVLKAKATRQPPTTFKVTFMFLFSLAAQLFRPSGWSAKPRREVRTTAVCCIGLGYRRTEKSDPPERADWSYFSAMSLRPR
jgi:hypothetical protein